jgi:hypothetical protein
VAIQEFDSRFKKNWIASDALAMTVRRDTVTQSKKTPFGV